MLTKAKVKFIKSLQEKKYRKQEQCFVVEGAKSVQEVLSSSFEVVMLVASDVFIESNRVSGDVELIRAKVSELASLGEFQTNNEALAVVRMRKSGSLHFPDDSFSLVLDDIRDPGNLGTIIRTADWYGISTIIASPETVDVYNPKVISSTKGSFTRVELHYEDLPQALKNVALPVYGAFLEGEDVHQTNFAKGGLIVMGNESNGISPAVEKLVTHKITIPRYGNAESLNAAIATAVILDNVKR